MADSERCSDCGVPLPPYWPKGLCASCALKGALEMTHARSQVRDVATPDVSPPLAGPGIETPILDSFGDYDLLEEIARGGMGVVYKARQKKLGRIVAVKMMAHGPLAGKEFVQRFRAEAAAAAVLQHPNIVAIHDVGVHEGCHYFSMDYVDGKNLAQLAAESPLPPPRAARYVQLAAEAIHYAHENGILHRDLKPSNVLIDAQEQPRITDFGLAKRLDGESDLTVTGQVLGSPNFMPPEQAGTKHGRVSRASDVYALGGILYFLLAGRPPFHAASLEQVIAQVLEREPVSPRMLNPSIPKDLETITLKCLEKEPSRRYRTARELGDELARFGRNEPIRARAIGPGEKVWRWGRRKPVLAALTLLLFVVSAIGVAGIFWQWRQAELHAQHAEVRAYASDMNLAQQALLANNVGRGSELLDRHVPSPGQPDRRGWEWRYLWQRTQSDELFTLCQRPVSILSLAISPDGRFLAVGERNMGHLTLWDLHSRRQLMQEPAGARPDILYIRASFSPTEPLLAYGYTTSSSDPGRNIVSRVRILNYITQREVAELPLDFMCSGLAFSPDGATLVTSTAYSLTLWDVRTRAKLSSYPLGSHQGTGTPFSITPDFRLVVQAFAGGRVRVVDLATGSALWSSKVSAVQIEAVALSSDGRFVAMAGASDESIIELRSSMDGRLIASFDRHPGGVMQLLFSPDNRTLISANTDQTIRIWDVSNPDAIPSPRVLIGHALEVWRLALMPDGRTLISGGKDGSVRFWDLERPPRQRGPIELPGGPYVSWSFAEESAVLTCDRKGQVARWEGNEWQDRTTVLNTGYDSTAACVLSDRRQVVIPGNDGALHVFSWSDAASPRAVSVFPRAGWIWNMRRHGNRLAVGRLDQGMIHDFDLNTWERVESWPAPMAPSAMDFSPDGRYCVMIAFRGKVLVRNMVTGEQSSFVDDLPNISGVGFSSRGDRLAIAYEQGYVRLWETGSWREAGTLRGFLRKVNGLSFSPDDQRLAAGSSGQEAIRLYELERDQPLVSLRSEGTGHRPVFDSSGNVLGAMNAEGRVRFWRAPSWAEIEATAKSAYRRDRR